MELFILLAVTGLVGALIGQVKNRVGLGIFLGLILGPIGWLIIALCENHSLKCPECGGVVVEGARKCKNCGSTLTEAVNQPVEVPQNRVKIATDRHGFAVRHTQKKNYRPPGLVEPVSPGYGNLAVWVLFTMMVLFVVMAIILKSLETA